MLRPVTPKEIVGPAAEQHVVGAACGLVEPLGQDLIAETHGPTALVEPVGGIFFRASWALHDAVEAHLHDCDDLSHFVFSIWRNRSRRPARRSASDAAMVE